MNTPYRREGDTWQIDLRLDRLQQLADTRDPSPFSRRDLAPDAERYILDACRELPAHEPLALNLWLPSHELSAETAERARHTVCFHFAWQAENSQRRLREHLRMAHRTTLLGLCFMAVCMLLYNLIGVLDNLLAQTLAEADGDRLGRALAPGGNVPVRLVAAAPRKPAAGAAEPDAGQPALTAGRSARPGNRQRRCAGVARMLICRRPARQLAR